jgi:hypothetical protein
VREGEREREREREKKRDRSKAGMEYITRLQLSIDRVATLILPFCMAKHIQGTWEGHQLYLILFRVHARRTNGNGQLQKDFGNLYGNASHVAAAAIGR